MIVYDFSRIIWCYMMLYVCMGHVALFLVLSGPKWWPLEDCTRRWGIMLASITFHTKNTSHLEAIQAISSMLFMHVLYAKWMIKHVGCPGTDLICSTWRLTPPKSLRDRSLLVPVPQKFIAALGWFWNVMKLPGLVSTYKKRWKDPPFSSMLSMWKSTISTGPGLHVRKLLT